MPDTTSEYAKKGSLAHELAELNLRKKFVPGSGIGPRKYKTQLDKFKESEYWEPEMLSAVDRYVDYITEIIHSFPSKPFVAVEKQVDYSLYAPEGFGTADCIIIHGGVITVCDFKYGKGVPVSAVGNHQMMLYALGAYLAYSLLYPIDTVKMAIIQPRRDSITEWEISLPDLLAWGESIKPFARLAWDGGGEYKVGEWCRFCKANTQCRARTDHFLSLETLYKMPPLISLEELGDILKRAEGISDWVKSLQELAVSALLKDEEVPGWKLVEGKSSRVFTDTDAVFKKLIANEYDEALLYERKPLPLTKIEDLITKPVFKKLLSEFVAKPKGKPTLVKEDDPREEYETGTSAEEDFKNDYKE